MKKDAEKRNCCEGVPVWLTLVSRSYLVNFQSARYSYDYFYCPL